ncbi:MAG: hypothetical protein RQ728_04795 [Brevefilum sp.]|nr:hypothetical protein [Brevefilum sp.]MDT8381556.1 hypothetical protein [Brevefilum sp.]MDW7753980.1 hypothetical protein [Brevefilum sp.]
MGVKSSAGDGQKSTWQGLGLALVSAGALCFEINLTRLFSVSQFYHFAFMVVSIALLGYGASGTYLSLRKHKNSGSEGKNFPLLAGLAGACMIGSFILINYLPFDSYSIFVNPGQLGILMLHYLALASPFFFIGMIVSLMLQKFSKVSGKVYAWNLVGSAAGCLIAVIVPGVIDGEGVVALSAIMASFGGLLFFIGTKQNSKDKGKRNIISLLLIIIILIASLLPISIRMMTGEMPGFFTLNISPYKSLSYALQNPQAEVISSQWNSISRIDLVQSPSLHSLPGLSYRYLDPLPATQGLFWDGDNLNPLLPANSSTNFAEHLQFAIAYSLIENPCTLILEPKGGMSIVSALALGANQITAVEANPLVIKAAIDIYTLPGVRTVTASGRSFLRSNKSQFDIIQLPLTDSYHPVSSGAYALGEDYRYTLESFSDMIDNLKPDGILINTRWLQEDPSEWLRTFTLAVTALENQGIDPSMNIIALRGYNTGTILVKKNAFKPEENDKIRFFAQEKAFDIVQMSDLKFEDVNQFNILSEPVYYQTFNSFLTSIPRDKLYENYPYDVRPPTDDRPFFGHYFKWSQMDQILKSLGTTWQPFGGAGYLAIIIIFIIALILSAGLILIPILINRTRKAKFSDKAIPVYFGLIGLGFMLIEIPLIQRFTLYLDQPAYAMAIVLFSILLFSGLGSRFGSSTMSFSTALLLLLGLLGVNIAFLPGILHKTLGLPLLIRVGISLIMISPLGFLMGVPFPNGLRWLRRKNQTLSAPGEWLIPYVWAVNGACSVISSILASLISLSFGFKVTFALGMVFYALAFSISRKETRLNIE